MKHKIKTFLCSIAFITATASQAQAYGEPYCREYTETFQIGGRSHQGYGTACLQPDGSWQKQDSAQESASYDEVYEQRKQNVVYVIDRRPVQIFRPHYRPHYRPVYRPYAYAQPTNFFSVSFGNSGYHQRPYYARPHNHGWGHRGGHVWDRHPGRGH